MDRHVTQSLPFFDLLVNRKYQLQDSCISKTNSCRAPTYRALQS